MAMTTSITKTKYMRKGRSASSICVALSNPMLPNLLGVLEFSNTSVLSYFAPNAELINTPLLFYVCHQFQKNHPNTHRRVNNAVQEKVLSTQTKGMRLQKNRTKGGEAARAEITACSFLFLLRLSAQRVL